MGIVVPEEFYIGFQSRIRFKGEHDWRDKKDTREKTTYRLGFATYLEDNAKFQKRKETITRWSEPYKKVFREDSKGSPCYISGRKDRPIGFMDGIEIPELQPRILDNVPLDGFRIPEEVRRYGWSGGNVVWRIVDPRGFELEISSNNLAQLLIHCTLWPGGIIEGRCLWGWEMKGGSKIVILPEGSQPYKDAMTHTEARGKKVKLSELQLGDRVQLLDETVGIFLGKYNMLFQDEDPYYDSRGHRQNTNATIVSRLARRGAFLTDKQELYLASEPKVSFLKEKTNSPLTPELAVSKINKILKNKTRFNRNVINSRGSLYDSECPILSFIKKPKPGDFELALVPLKMGFQGIVASQKEPFNSEKPNGLLFSRNSKGELETTRLGWDTYGGGNDSSYKRALRGEAVVNPGIFHETEKRFGYILQYTRNFRHRSFCSPQEPVVTNVNRREWKYPVIKFEGEEFPLIYIPQSNEIKNGT